MTLKEEFEQYAKQEVWEKKNYNAEECEQIAEDFAIGFADWYISKVIIKEMHLPSTKQLLEIYKKEKGL